MIGAKIEGIRATANGRLSPLADSMPPFRPAKAAVPKSGLGVRVPFRERPKDIPKDDDEPKPEGAGGRPGAVLWARRLPYKMVQGSHIGHGIRMEPSRKEPPEWKDPKRRLKFGAAPAEAAAGAAGVNDENAGPAKANAASPAAAPAPTKAAAGSKSRASGAHGKGGGARNGGGAGGRAAGGTTKATANNGKPGGKHGGAARQSRPDGGCAERGGTSRGCAERGGTSRGGTSRGGTSRGGTSSSRAATRVAHEHRHRHRRRRFWQCPWRRGVCARKGAARGADDEAA